MLKGFVSGPYKIKIVENMAIMTKKERKKLFKYFLIKIR